MPASRQPCSLPQSALARPLKLLWGLLPTTMVVRTKLTQPTYLDPKWIQMAVWIERRREPCYVLRIPQRITPSFTMFDCELFAHPPTPVRWCQELMAVNINLDGERLSQPASSDLVPWIPWLLSVVPWVAQTRGEAGRARRISRSELMWVWCEYDVVDVSLVTLTLYYFYASLSSEPFSFFPRSSRPSEFSDLNIITTHNIDSVLSAI